MGLTLKAVKHPNVFALQRGDNLGVSGRRRESSKDLQLFTKDEQVVPKQTVIQQQEQILWESQVLDTLLPQPVTIILQVSKAYYEVQ